MYNKIEYYGIMFFNCDKNLHGLMQIKFSRKHKIQNQAKNN